MRLKNMLRMKLIFERINYKPKECFDFFEYERLFLTQIAKCTNVQDVNLLVLDYLFVIKKYRKITRFLTSKNKWKYNLIDLDSDNKITYYPDDLCVGNYVFTTGLSKKHNIIHYISFGETEIYQVKKQKNYYQVYENNEFVLFHKNNKVKIKKDKEIMLTLSMNRNLEITLKENAVNYEIIKDGSLYTINDVLLQNDERLQATIDCDILEENKINASSLVEIYNDDDELLLLIGIGILLLIQNQMKMIDNRVKLMMATTLLNMRRRH